MPARKCPSCGTKIPKSTRAPNAYNDFVKQAMARPDVQKLEPKSRMKAVAALWRQQKSS